MNANELADKLDEAADDLESENIFAWEERAAATMLRQQQAEIEALKADLKYWTDPCDPMCKPSICDCYQARFAINNRKAQEK